MIDKTDLYDKQVLFRLVSSTAYPGIVRSAEDDGFWIESPALINEVRRDAAWGPLMEQIQAPIFFVPTVSLMYLLAAKPVEPQ